MSTLIYQRERPLPAAGGTLCVVGLNPLLADTSQTLTRCARWGEAWGHGKLVMVNCWPIATDARLTGLEQWVAAPPVEAVAANVRAVLEAAASAALTIVAWGAHPLGGGPVLEALLNAGCPLHCLGTTASGAPTHPMARGRARVPDDVTPTPWHPPAQQAAQRLDKLIDANLSHILAMSDDEVLADAMEESQSAQVRCTECGWDGDASDLLDEGHCPEGCHASSVISV